MLRMVECPHVKNCGHEPQTPLPKTAIALGNVTFLVHAALCVNCADEYRMGARVYVEPEGCGLGEGIPDMMIWRADQNALVQARASVDDEPDRQDVARVTIAGRDVTLYREKRLADQELARWAQAFGRGEIPPRTFRAIAASIAAGPLGQPAGRRVHARSIPAGDPNAGDRSLQGRPNGVPGKHDTRVRLDWRGKQFGAPPKE